MAQSTDPLGQYCNYNSNITAGSQVLANINWLLPQLVSKTESNGYVATSYGLGKEKVYGLAQCRGDVGREDCASCIQDAAKQVRQRCPNQADARIWYDYCFLRYSLEDFAGKIDASFGIFYWNIESVADPETFNRELGSLMDRIESQAIEPNTGGLGKGETKLSPFITLYALVQCTRDLSPADCAQCLAIAVGKFPTYCENRKGCRVLYSSCYVRYELYPFFFPLDSNSTQAGSSETVMGVIAP